MKKDNIVYLEDILESIEKIENFISGLDEARFISDEKVKTQFYGI